MSDAPRGIVTVLNTPFTVDNDIDLSGLAANVRYAVNAGVAGFLVPAMASEVDWLTPQEKREIVKVVVQESAGRAVVIGGASSAEQSARIERASEFLAIGCDGVLIQLEAQRPADEMEQDLRELAELNPGILMVQDWDSEGTGLTLPMILRLFERIPEFNWLKIEVTNAGPKYSEVLEATDGRLNVAGGWAVTQMIDGLDRGVHAFMPTGMHRVYVEIHRRYAAGDRAGAAQLFGQIQPVLAFSNQSLEISIRFFKRLLHAQGIYATPNVRLDGSDFDAEQQRAADGLIDAVLSLEEQFSGN